MRPPEIAAQNPPGARTSSACLGRCFRGSMPPSSTDAVAIAANAATPKNITRQPCQHPSPFIDSPEPAWVYDTCSHAS